MSRRTRFLTLSAVGLATLIAVPATAWWRTRDRHARTTAQDFRFDLSLGEDAWTEIPTPGLAEIEGPQGDDPRRRMMANRALFGRWTNEARLQHMREAEREAQRYSLRPSYDAAFRASTGMAPAPGDVGEIWTNLGPSDARFQWNGEFYQAVDSGRVTGIVAHPTDVSTIYVSMAGGGVWKTTQLGEAENPAWQDKGFGLGNQAVGGLALDPNNPDTLYAGLGDPFDTEGGQVSKSTNGGDDWSAAVNLAGTSPAGNPVGARTVRDVRVAPTDSNVVLVASDVGLFRSTDAGASYALVDLPNADGGNLLEAIWSIVHLGGSGFAVSGVQACDPSRLPPTPASGVTAGKTIPGTDPGVACVSGNPGDIWVTNDAGATWTSRRANGALPARAGRITLTSAPAATAAQATVYAMVGSEDETSQIGVWRSTDGANTFADARGSLANGNSDCPTPDVGNVQIWYNQAISVDPGNPDNVLMGGMLCSVRTTSGRAGTPTWDNASHWLPVSLQLPYVHADWHKTLAVALPGGGVRLIAGTDGGVYISENIFTASPAQVTWRGVNRGLVTHLHYSIASGDVATGNPVVAFSGLQDNGTRFRDLGLRDSTFNQVIGGDGIGATSRRLKNGATRYFASVNGSRMYCDPGADDPTGCDYGGGFLPTTASIPNCAPQGDPFFIRYSPVMSQPYARAVLTASNRAILRADEGPSGPVWKTISPCFESTQRTHIPRGVQASQVHDGLFGSPLSGGRFAVTSNCQGTKTDCTWDISERLGFDLDGDGELEKTESILFTNGMDFPAGDTGKALGDVYVVVSGAPVTEADTPVPAALGHVFLTEDRGVTWQRISGDLPNVPGHVVRYDPADKTNQTIYVGTDLGVYVTRNGGTNWTRLGEGLPMVRVVDLYISHSGGMIRAATYGRGLWEIHPGAVTPSVAGDKDADGNGSIDFFDLAAAAVRLGKTPATNTAPLYERRLDSTGLGTIDEADLSAVVNSLGNDS